MNIVKSLSIFFLAGLCEIGGGYLIWLWLKSDKPLWYGILGAVILMLYGVVAHGKLQTSAGFTLLMVEYLSLWLYFGPGKQIILSLINMILSELQLRY